MRIYSIVTLVSPDGEYGGPVRVAINQARELRAQGHEVVICGGTRGFDRVPDDLEGVPARLFPVYPVIPRSGFAGLISPGLLGWLVRNVAMADLCHVHAARDLVTLPAAVVARAKGVPYVLQTHGMIDPSSNPLAKPLDALLTRPILRHAHRILYLTEVERHGVVGVGGDKLPLAELPNGVPQAQPAQPSPSRGSEVLYLARLAPRKRPRLFVEVAAALAEEFPGAQFVLIGPDEGEGAAVTAAIGESAHSDRISWAGPLPPELTVERMRQASIYVLPSINEPYPMSVLEALSVGLPVVITNTCGLADVVRQSGAGAVVDESMAALRDALRTLMSDPEEARAAGLRGRDYVRKNLSMEAIARRLAELYRP